MQFVLASASPARLSVLRAGGLDPVVEVADLDEPSLLATMRDDPPQTKVIGLAVAKATEVAGRLADRYVEAVVVGCDSMLLIDGELVGKPADVDDARARWGRMAGECGELLTGHAVLHVRNGAVDRAADGHAVTIVRFGRPSPAELEAYLATREPLAVAGAFTLDGLGGWFVDGIDGDPSNVIGISLPLTRRLLAEIGVTVTDLWQTATKPG